MSDTELKPCPFCGGEAEEALCDWKPAIRCKSCHATVYREYFKHIEHAEVIMWNTRRPMERIVEHLKEYKENCCANDYPRHYESVLDDAIEIVRKGGAE